MRTTCDAAAATAASSSADRCRRSAPFSAGRGLRAGAWLWSRSPPPSDSARPCAPARRAAPGARRPHPRRRGESRNCLISTIAGTRVAHWPKTSGTRCGSRRASVQNEARRGDDAVAAFLLNAGSRRGTCRSRPCPARLRKRAPGVFRISGSPWGVLPSPAVALHLEARELGIVDLAQIVREAQ